MFSDVIFSLNGYHSVSVLVTDPQNNTSKKLNQQSHFSKTKKKHAEKHGRDGKQSFNHQWLLTSLKGHSSSVLDMEFSPNGKYLATCGEGKSQFLCSSM